MAILVVDASVVVALLVGSEPRVRREALGGAALAAPAHVDAEALSALFGLARGRALDARRLARAVADLATAPVRRLPIAPLMNDAVPLRHNLSAFDALYVAAARALRCALVTRDRRLASTPGLGVAVTVV
jgi:predicted nucleic acid-binding protein